MTSWLGEMREEMGRKYDMEMSRGVVSGDSAISLRARFAASTNVFNFDSHTWRLVLLACSGQKVGMLPSVLECSGQPLSQRIIRTKCPQCCRREAVLRRGFLKREGAVAPPGGLVKPGSLDPTPRAPDAVGLEQDPNFRNSNRFPRDADAACLFLLLCPSSILSRTRDFSPQVAF